jgi:putative ABC transport system permease protein
MQTALAAFWYDVRYAVRGYLRTPLFTSVAIATLALGIGSTTAIFSVIDAVVLRALPYPHASGLVAVAALRRETGAVLPMSPPNYFDFRERSRAFSALAAYGTPSVTISGLGAEPEKVLAAACSHDLFAVLGVATAVGSAFTSRDTLPGAAPVSVISHGLWQRRFGGQSDIVGREIFLDGTSTIVVGVMPPSFAFPAPGTDLWMPMRLSRTQPPNPGIPASGYRGYRILSVIGRLRTDVRLEAAREEAIRLGDILARDYPDANRNLTVAVRPYHDVVVGSARPALIVLFGAVACVLLIACANASSLILARAAARSRELAIRRAIGATRGRLAGQMITESTVLAVAGGSTGLLIAAWTVDVFVRLAPAGIPRLTEAQVDGASATFALAIAMVAGVLFGIVPALHVRRSPEQDALAGAGRGTVTTANQRTRYTLVVAEVALATMLMVGASLLIESFVRLSRVDAGFQTAAVVAVDRVELPRTRTSLARSGAFFDDLLARLRETPGVDGAGATIGLPLDPRARFYVDESTFSVAGRPVLPVGQRPSAALHVVAGDYFAAAGIPLQRGRFFDARDGAGAPAVVLINEAMARRYWPNDDPLGRTVIHDLTILPGQSNTRQIVGIVGDVRHFGLEQSPEPQMFIPHLQMPWPSMALVLRTSLPRDRVNAIVRDAVHALDAAIPVPPARGLEQIVSAAIGQPRFRAWLVGLFAAAALLLAMVGLYGTIAFSVQQRTRELGLRMALGASPRQTTRLVVAGGLKLATLGAALGIVGAVALTRLLAAMLFGVGVTDPTTLAMAATGVIVVAAVACYLPARRVRRIEPLRALTDGGAW